MMDYHQEVYPPLNIHEHFKDQYPSLPSIQDCCTHNKEFIENVKDECGDDQYMDEEVLEILHEYSTKR